MIRTVDYQVQRTPCPQCGDNSQVHTARELFDTLNGGARPTAGNTTSAAPPNPGGFGAAPFQSPAGNSTAQPQGQGGNTAGTQPQGQGGNTTGTPAPGQNQAWPAADQGQAQGPGQGAWPAANQGQGAWPAADQGQQGHPDDGSYDHYSAENSNRWNQRDWRRDIFRPEKLADDATDAVVGAALGFAGRAIGRRMKKAFEEKILPAMEARAQQAQGMSQQQREQARAEQDAIVARYPELRGCLKDGVLFIDGGYKTVPVSELGTPVTLAQADAIVARLR